jgi:AraC-like DNA-binding protein
MRQIFYSSQRGISIQTPRKGRSVRFGLNQATQTGVRRHSNLRRSDMTPNGCAGLEMIASLAGERTHLFVANLVDICSADVKIAELSSPKRRPIRALQLWRLRRVEAYIRSHISETIKLADLANAAGLTRMYFASQFRAKTGIRPHEYVILERIAYAQTLLMVPQIRTRDVGFSVGFANQAHFTTVFRRYVGSPPHLWRLSQAPERRVNSMYAARFRATAPD